MEAYEGKTSRLKRRCPHCEGGMDEGYVQDRGESNAGYQQEWVEGPPIKRSMWLGGGISTKGARRYAVATLRCDTCGYLMSFATEPLNDV